MQVVKHMYKYHLINEKTKDYRLHLLHIYFILKALKNPYLAYFLSLDFTQQSLNDNFITRNRKHLAKCYLDKILFTKQL